MATERMPCSTCQAVMDGRIVALERGVIVLEHDARGGRFAPVVHVTPAGGPRAAGMALEVAATWVTEAGAGFAVEAEDGHTVIVATPPAERARRRWWRS